MSSYYDDLLNGQQRSSWLNSTSYDDPYMNFSANETKGSTKSILNDLLTLKKDNKNTAYNNYNVTSSSVQDIGNSIGYNGFNSGSYSVKNSVYGDYQKYDSEVDNLVKNLENNSINSLGAYSYSQNKIINNRPVVGSYQSSIENAVINAREPISSFSNKVVNVNGESGVLLNEEELRNWRGPIPLSQYEINQDSNPQIIRKRANQTVNYVQDVNIRYLKPPTPPPPGDIIITQQPNKVTPPAPPLIIRQQAKRPLTPPPLVIREAPPPPPQRIQTQHITIPGKTLPPPPRKVIVEKLPEMPQKPRSVIIDRWLPYDKVKRRVILRKSDIPDPVVLPPKNVYVNWERPDVNVTRELRTHGVYKVDPSEYIQRYGHELRNSNELPSIAIKVPGPSGHPLASQTRNECEVELEGDVDALSYVDLNKIGLGNCKVTSRRAYRTSPISPIYFNDRVSPVRYYRNEFVEPNRRYVENVRPAQYYREEFISQPRAGYRYFDYGPAPANYYDECIPRRNLPLCNPNSSFGFIRPRTYEQPILTDPIINYC